MVLRDALTNGFAHSFETMVLNQFDNSAKTRSHVGRESFDLTSNAGVENFNDPRHPL
jgi:hypothetical protein